MTESQDRLTSDQTVPADRMPRDDEPGGADTPLATEGEGTVGLEARTAPDQKGSPATNQGTAEPMPSTPGHRDPNAPLEPPSLDEMTVGVADPQRPSLPTAAAAPTTGAEPGPGSGPQSAPRDLSGPGAAPFQERPAGLGRNATGVDLGPDLPSSGTAGQAHRAPGLQGTTSPAEEVETDVDSSAAAMVRDTGRDAGAGNVHGVPVPSEEPSPGTSQEHGVVQGARIPVSDPARSSQEYSP